MQDETALRPSMPTDPAELDRWIRVRTIDAMTRLSTAAEQLTAAVRELHQVVAVLAARTPGPAE